MTELEDASADLAVRHFFILRFNPSRPLRNTSSLDFPLNSERQANSPAKRSLLRPPSGSAHAERQLAFRRVCTSWSVRTAESDFPARSTVRVCANTKIDTEINATVARDTSLTRNKSVSIAEPRSRVSRLAVIASRRSRARRSNGSKRKQALRRLLELLWTKS